MGPSVHPSIHKMCIARQFWPILDGFRGFLGHFGWFSGHFGGIFGPFLVVSEAIWAFLGYFGWFKVWVWWFWRHFGQFWVILDGFQAISGLFGLFFGGLFWVVSRSFWTNLGSFQAVSDGIAWFWAISRKKTCNCTCAFLPILGGFKWWSSLGGEMLQKTEIVNKNECYHRCCYALVHHTYSV